MLTWVYPSGERWATSSSRTSYSSARSCSSGPGGGERPWTDYAAGEDCTNGNCDRRGDYLKAATELLVSDLEWMTGQWNEDGPARAALVKDPDAGIVAMLTGMGSLSYGEQAGERMKVGVMLNDPEEEHDCFSDNTHNSHFYDGMGIRNVYVGEYVHTDGSVVSGPSLSEFVAAADPQVDADLREDLSRTMIELGQIKAVAEAGFAYDMMLARGNEGGEALIMDAVDALVAQTRSVERAVAALGLEQIGFEGACLAGPHGDGDDRGQEIDAEGLDLVTFYSRNLGVPERPEAGDPEVLRGKRVSYETGYTECHTPKHVTHRLEGQPEQSFQLIRPYTDLLLHDMGAGLADHRLEGRATGREWHAPPLWGIGRMEQVNGHTYFLHDGRARSLLEAVLWHSGEAQKARDAVAGMPEADRAALIRFLESL